MTLYMNTVYVTLYTLLLLGLHMLKRVGENMSWWVYMRIDIVHMYIYVSTYERICMSACEHR